MTDCQPTIVSPTATAGAYLHPPPYPGMPVGLEAVTPEEALWLGRRVGIDVPLYVTPSGWGEWVPVLTDIDSVQDLLVLDPATGHAEAQPRD